jgi:hypothetical protein
MCKKIYAFIGLSLIFIFLLCGTTYAKQMSSELTVPTERQHHYIVFDKVYPFTNLEQMLEVIDSMNRLQTPFILSVMPIYQNGEYPAMKRFCEVLRYAQANGACVILHAPIVKADYLDAEEIQAYMTIALKCYIGYGVYPIGIEVPTRWLFQQEGMEVLKSYRTIFVCEDNWVEAEADWNTYLDDLYKEGHQFIGPASVLEQPQRNFIHVDTSAVYLDILEPIDKLEKRIKTYKKSDSLLKNLWELSHKVDTDSIILQYENSVLTLNNEPINMEYKPFEYEQEPDYRKNIIDRVTVDLKNQNKVLIGVVSIVLGLFTLFIVLARHENRKKFFYPKEK